MLKSVQRLFAQRPLGRTFQWTACRSYCIPFTVFHSKVFTSSKNRTLATKSGMSGTVNVRPFLDKDSNTFTYLVSDPATKETVIIDSVLDFELASFSTSTTLADTLVEHVQKEGLKIKYILDTHSHADHLSGANYLKTKFPGSKWGISEHVVQTQSAFKDIFKLTFPDDGSQFDFLMKDGDVLPLGSNTIKVIYTPGHTIDSNTYLIGDAVFVGDTLFKEDSGTARCDFPNGNASLLWDSIQKILSLPGSTRLFLCHDYGAGNKRELLNETTVQGELDANIHVKKGTSKDEFVSMRDARDASLSLPRLILPSIQFNIQGGQNVEYLKFILNKAEFYSRNYKK